MCFILQGKDSTIRHLPGSNTRQQWDKRTPFQHEDSQHNQTHQGRDEGKEKREKKESIETQGQNTNCGRKDCISWRLLAEGSHFQCIMGHLPAA